MIVLPRKPWGRIVGRTSSARIFEEQIFDRTPELEISAADFFEEGMAVPRLDCQGGIKELLDQLLLTSHNPRSNEISRDKEDMRRGCPIDRAANRHG
jgi:hypothetical protein